jgi:hypothetical protein
LHDERRRALLNLAKFNAFSLDRQMSDGLRCEKINPLRRTPERLEHFQAKWTPVRVKKMR